MRGYYSLTLVALTVDSYQKIKGSMYRQVGCNTCTCICNTCLIFAVHFGCCCYCYYLLFCCLLGAAYNAHFDPDRYYVTTENGEFYIEDGDSNPQQIDLTRNNGRPMYLQFDWISRRLYWVEEQKVCLHVHDLHYMYM